MMMYRHVLVAFGAVFCASFFHITQSLATGFDSTIREKRSPQNNGLFFQANGGVNLPGLNLQQVASNVRKRLHELVDTVTNPLNINVVAQVDPTNVNYENNQQYDYVDQHEGPPPRGPPPRFPPDGPPPRFPPDGPPPRFSSHGPPRGPPHGHPPRGPPHGHPPGGPPHGHPPRGPPHGHPPRGPPHGHPPHGPPPGGPPHGPPPRDFPPRDPEYEQNPTSPPNRIPFPEKPVYEDTNEGNTENLPETRPNFSQQPNYPGTGNSNVNIDLSNTPPTSTAINLDEQSKDAKADSNVVGYLENNFPVILLNENEIR